MNKLLVIVDEVKENKEEKLAGGKSGAMINDINQGERVFSV